MSVMTVILNGKEASEEVLRELRELIPTLAKVPRLAIVHFDPPDRLSPFIRAKVRAAEAVGIECRLYPMPQTISSSKLSERLHQIVHEAHVDGVVLQLPLPPQLEKNRHGILRIIPEEKDVDCLSERFLGRMVSGRTTLRLRHGDVSLVPPVAAAIAYWIDREHIEVVGKRVVVVGWGDLVGKPVALWFLNQGATVTVARSTERDLGAILRSADIVVTGAGKPGLVRGEMVRDGVILFDAATSEDRGLIRGDIDASAAARASFVTPVPGGLGPLAVAMLLRNLVLLTAASFGYRGSRGVPFRTP
jgi:methylenetetrahydrofolate dehydrogenase (NADP+)/methenyltetrahydrofolate cyclohydrolase